MAFDRHMNLVLGDAEEYRKLPPKKGKSEDEVLPRYLLPFLPAVKHAGRSQTQRLSLRQSRSQSAASMYAVVDR